MRHRVAGTKFNVDKDHRDSLLKNLLTSFIVHETLTTTEAKAKALKSMFDKIITRAKKQDIQARRLVGRYITDNEAMIKLFDNILPKLQERTAGYSRTTMLVGERAGDSAKMMTISILLDKVMVQEEKGVGVKGKEKKVVKSKSVKTATKAKKEAVIESEVVKEGEEK